MIKVINGKRYNTEKANCIAYYNNCYHSNDFNYYKEYLFLTSAGNYFLFGSGNAYSKYSCRVGNNGRGGSSDIIPMTREDALAWAEEHASPDELEHFNESIEEA